jgi:hypothetical protein
MPNGGYNVSVLLRVRETSFGIRVNAATVELVSFLETPERDENWPTIKSVKLGELTHEQVSALLYHLEWWACGPMDEDHGVPRLMYRGKRVQPQWRSSDCAYDY